MTDQKELAFNYNDLNLDFLELSPPRASAVGAISTVSNSFSMRPSAYKAKQLAQRVAQNDVLVNQIELLKKENSKLQQMLKDFQKSATHIQKLYENEKKKCNDFQTQQMAVELKSKELETHCAQLNNDIAEKIMQLEQLEAKLDETKGPLSYTELAMKYLKLMQKLNEDENLNVRGKPLFLKLSKYCEDKGCKVPILKVCKRKRIYKKDKNVQCNLMESSCPPISKEFQTKSAVESQTQTDFPESKDIQKQTLEIDAKSSKSVQSHSVQTTLIELRTQGTQHISTTTTRGTSTSCFIKKHNVGTCFPEPTILSPVKAMIDEVLQEYTVSPLSPICDLISLPSHNEFKVSKPAAVAHTTVSFKSIGTCTYLCNVQRRIDFIPLVTNIKRSQSSSPSLFTCDSVKHEAYTTPTPSPPPPPVLPSTSGNRNTSAADETGTNNLSNMQPMLSAFTHLPNMQPEVFSTIWQMAGQMCMGLLYPPTENHMRIIQLNRANNALNQQQFHNWITSLYESIQQPQQESTSTPLPHTECQQYAKRGERAFNLDAEINANVIQPNNNSSRCKVSTELDDCSTNEMVDMRQRNVFGANESTQKDNSIPSSNSHLCEGKYFVDWIFKEPLEIPKRSAKQTRKRKGAAEKPTYMKRHRVKRMRKKRRKEKLEIAKSMNCYNNNNVEQINTSESDAKSVVEFSTCQRNEQDFATAVEFCANLCNFSTDPCKQIKCGDDTEAQKTNTIEVCVDNSSIEERLESCGSNEVNFGLEQNKNIKQIRINEDVEVPDDLLPDSENNKCDALDNIGAKSDTEAQQESCRNQLKQKHNTAYSLFGSDSEEEDELNSFNVDDMGRSETCLIIKKSDELLDSKAAEQTGLKKDSYKPAETGTNSSISISNENVNSLRTATCELTKTSAGNEDNIQVEQILLDLAISDSESDENEASKPSYSINSFDNFTTEAFSEVDETDDPLLVIVEDVPESTNTHQLSIESNPANQDTPWNPQSPTKAPSQQNDSDTDISALLDSSLVDDLIANASTQQLFNSILRESANDLKADDGRKRKSDMSAVMFCKRSERLRAKLSCDESLTSPSKYSNNGRNTPKPSNTESCDDISMNYYNPSPEKSLSKSPLHLLSKEQIDNEFQRFTEIKQRTNINKVVDNQSITATQNEVVENGVSSGVCENSFAVTYKESFSESSHPCPADNEGISTYGPSNTSNLYSCPEICEQISAHCPPINQTDYDSPSSPPPASCTDITFDNVQPCKEIPLELNNSYYPIARRSILHHLINYYSANIYAIVTGKKKQHALESKTAVQLEMFLNTTRDKVDVLASTLAISLHEQFDDCEVIANLIIDQVIKAPRPETELECEVTRVPPKCLGTHLRLTSIVLRHLHHKRPEIAATLLAKIENKLFNYQNSETISLSGALNLTQLYLLVIPLHNNQFNPARLFLAKCLYYYNIQASPMIYEVLCWYPTTLPHRDEPNYDRSDALIIVIQHLLMCTTYNMDSKDLRHRELLSLLRFEYHFEPFQPKSLEVLSILVTKLKTGNLTNLRYAFAIFCKRQPKLVEILLQQQLLPLADEYYKLVSHSNNYDERAAALLECISVVVKPLPLDTDVSFYLSIFERFLGTVQRPVVQEAAVLAILRLQRFGVNRCFHALVHFKPNYQLQMLTTNALKTFVHKKPLKYWKCLLMQTMTNER